MGGATSDRSSRISAAISRGYRLASLRQEKAQSGACAAALCSRESAAGGETAAERASAQFTDSMR